MPDDDAERDWQVAADLAVRWVRQECTAQGVTGVLVLNALGVEGHSPSLRRFAAEHAVTTPRASRNRVERGVGPVLAYVPDEKSLDFAMGLARGSSLVVVEGIHTFPLSGWARQLGAVDLTRTKEGAREIDPALATAIDRMDFYKNNGFGDHFGKQQAHRILDDLRGAGQMDGDVILGALAARGASARAVKNLRKLIHELDRR